MVHLDEPSPDVDTRSEKQVFRFCKLANELFYKGSKPPANFQRILQGQELRKDEFMTYPMMNI